MKLSELKVIADDKKLEWNADPKLGWFMESDPLTLYYGAQKKEVEAILENGIFADDSGFVTCAFEPYTAYSQGAVLTESIDQQERVVFIIEMPLAYNEKHPVFVEDDKIVNKELYEEWGKSDSEYYALVEAKVAKLIPINFIKGYMIKNDC